MILHVTIQIVKRNVPASYSLMANFDDLSNAQKDEIKRKILHVMHKFGRPTMIGEVARETKESLEVTESVMEEMCWGETPDDTALLRKLYPSDPRLNGKHSLVVLYETTSPVSLKFAHDSDSVKLR